MSPSNPGPKVMSAERPEALGPGSGVQLVLAKRLQLALSVGVGAIELVKPGTGQVGWLAEGKLGRRETGRGTGR